MAGTDRVLGQFKLDYHHHGSYNLDIQVFHLARLAEFYVEKYKRTHDWTDCIKAHSLYNSISARKPEHPAWKERVFDVQKMYLEDNSSISFIEQQVVTRNLKAKLNEIRAQCRSDISVAHELAEAFEVGDAHDDHSQALFGCMRGISMDCSDKMADFAGQIIDQSVNILKLEKPPCDFVAVAIGSIARGEATPYSDLEYFFLIEENSPKTVKYFEKLAIITYFQIGNLGETKLAYMAIEELEGWFEDKAMNGLKIDGLSEKAGNIPTGNGSASQLNHFIVAPEELASRYKLTLDKPDRKVAVRGDLTAMLTYMKPLYTHQNGNRDLLGELRDQIASCDINQERREINNDMLNTDVEKFNFKPSADLHDKGFGAHVKKEIYRFPSILLLDVAIVTQSAGVNSWDTLQHNQQVSAQLKSALELLLAGAAYMRLSVYLYHDSQDDRMSVSQEIKQGEKAQSQHISKSQRRWFVPSGLFIVMCGQTISLKRKLSKVEDVAKDLDTIALAADDPWPQIITLYYTGRYHEALGALKQLYGDGVCHDPSSVIQKMPSEQNDPETLHIISETLFRCDQFSAAIVFYKHMTENNITQRWYRIADCCRELRDYDEAITILEGISDKSAYDHYSLGQAYDDKKEFQKAEQSYLQALELFYSEISSEKQYDYYGDPIDTDGTLEMRKILFTSITSLDERLNKIIRGSPNVIRCVILFGVGYNKQEQYELAETYYKKALLLISELYGKGIAVSTAAITLFNLGENYHEMGQYTDAENYYKQSLNIDEKLSQGAKKP